MTTWILRINGFFMSVILFVCSLLGIRIDRPEPPDLFVYNEAHTAVCVNLEENASTGYTWWYSLSESDVLRVTRNEYSEQTMPGLVGMPGMRSVTFEGVQAGMCVLTFAYARAWENRPTRVVTIACRVSDDLRVEAALLKDVG